MKTIESYLPIFQGFYGTHFESDIAEENVMYNLEEDGENAKYQDIEFDYVDYRNRVAEKCISSIWNELKSNDLDIDIEFDAVYSPRFYNFENDVINCTYKVSNEDFEKIVKYCETNIEEFTEYLKENYSSYSGFHSFFDTEPNIWFRLYLDEDNNKFQRAFAGILKFLLENEGYTIDEMYNDAQEETSYIDYKLPTDE